VDSLSIVGAQCACSSFLTASQKAVVLAGGVNALLTIFSAVDLLQIEKNAADSI